MQSSPGRKGKKSSSVKGWGMQITKKRSNKAPPKPTKKSYPTLGGGIGGWAKPAFPTKEDIGLPSYVAQAAKKTEVFKIPEPAKPAPV